MYVPIMRTMFQFIFKKFYVFNQYPAANKKIFNTKDLKA